VPACAAFSPFCSHAYEEAGGEEGAPGSVRVVWEVPGCEVADCERGAEEAEEGWGGGEGGGEEGGEEGGAAEDLGVC